MAEQPEDLGIKIGTDMEAYWTNVKENMTKAIEDSKKEIIYCSEVLKLAEKKIEEEQNAR